MCGFLWVHECVQHKARINQAADHRLTEKLNRVNLLLRTAFRSACDPAMEAAGLSFNPKTGKVAGDLTSTTCRISELPSRCVLDASPHSLQASTFKKSSCKPTALVRTESGCPEVVDDNDQTSVPNIFAIGDVLRLSNHGN